MSAVKESKTSVVVKTESGGTPSSASTSAASGSQANPNTKTFELRVPKKLDRKVFVAKFSNTLGVDFSTWKKNAPEFSKEKRVFDDATRTEEDDKAEPKAGAGSEYGKDKRDEARRKRYTRRAATGDAPWIMTDTTSQKKYKGSREGGVQDNSSYYVFSTTGGVIEAYPISEWFTFVPVQRYKALDSEEAEEAFGKRDKVFNYFNLMYKKRLGKTDEGEEEGGGEGSAAKTGPVRGGRSKLKISDGDDDLMPGEMSDSDEEGAAGDTEAVSGEAKKGKKKGKGKPKKVPKKSKKHKEGEEEDGEPAEESDDGDYEDREVDYESSESEPDDLDRALEDMGLKGVDEEVGEIDDDEDETEEKEDGEKEKTDVAGEDNAGSESDNEEEDFDAMADSVLPKAKKSDNVETVAGGASGSGSATRITKEPQGVSNPSGKGKRKLDTESPASTNKRGKAATGAGSAASTSDGKLEALIRSYLSRKPFTSKELLKKLIAKHGIRPEDIKSRLGDIIKRLNPEKTTINDKLYMHLKN